MCVWMFPNAVSWGRFLTCLCDEKQVQNLLLLLELLASSRFAVQQPAYRMRRMCESSGFAACLPLFLGSFVALLKNARLDPGSLFPA